MKEAVRAGASEAAAQTSPRVTLRPKLARRAPGDDSVSAVGAVGAHAQGHGERSRLQLLFRLHQVSRCCNSSFKVLALWFLSLAVPVSLKVF